MQIIFSPQRNKKSLSIIKTGDALTINGEGVDFSGLADGAKLTQAEINNPWICGEVSRVDGELIVPVLLPHGANAPETRRFPEPITVVNDGEVTLPDD